MSMLMALNSITASIQPQPTEIRIFVFHWLSHESLWFCNGKLIILWVTGVGASSTCLKFPTAGLFFRIQTLRNTLNLAHKLFSLLLLLNYCLMSTVPCVWGSSTLVFTQGTIIQFQHPPVIKILSGIVTHTRLRLGIENRVIEMIWMLIMFK